MAQIRVGQRVRVIDGGLSEYYQLGTVVAAGSSASWYVHLDGAAEPTTQTFFQAEELQALPAGASGSARAAAERA